MAFKKTLSLLCAASLMLTMAACKNDKNTLKPADGSENMSVRTTTQVTQVGEVGEKTEMADVEIQINKIYRSEYLSSRNNNASNIIFLDVTIKNNTEEELEPNMLSSFEFEVDGEYYDFATLFALNSAKKQFGNDVDLFSEPLRPTEARTGCIPAELPQEFSSATVKFLPLGGINSSGNSSQAILYTFTPDDMEGLAKPESTEAPDNTAE